MRIDNSLMAKYEKGVQLKTLCFPLYTFYYLYLTEPKLCKHFSLALSREEIT